MNKNPLSWTPEKVSYFISACRTNASFHFKNSPEIRELYTRKKFDPCSIQKEEDIGRIPMLGVTAMKYHLLLSMPKEQVALMLTSSGTRGQKTQIWMDAESLERVQEMLEQLWEQEGLIDYEPTNYLMFVYDPKDAKDLGIAFSDKNQQRFAPVSKSFYVLQKNFNKNSNGEWEFLKEKTLEVLKDYEKEGKPVRIFGIPSFLFEFLEGIKENFKLNEQSLVMTGGGWKAAEDKQVTRVEFRKLITKQLGIPDERIRDGYGMAEHCAPYMDCRAHRFHVPVYNRVLVRDPVTLEVLPVGRPGLLELVTPFNFMMPNLALLTTDLGVLDKDPCPCGYNAPTFTLLGRGGLIKHKGCAMTAGDIIKR